VRTPPPSLAAVAARVDARLADLLAAESARWSAFDDQVARPIDDIRSLVLAGGKRLRPAFCTWGYVGAGGAVDDRRVVDAGAAFELLHAFALFHDDVMDGSDSRRGQPTAHRSHADAHRDRGWAGEPRRFGEGVAILVGDLAFVYADLLMHGAPAEAWEVWNELRIELNVGQYLDVIGSASSERRRAQAERICRYKSGKYTIERPLHLGAVLAAPHRRDELLPALSRFGLPLGDAFQMRDDVLGAFGAEQVTGKPVGDDLREGKPTPLMAMATERATPAQRAVLAKVGDVTMSPDTVAEIQEAIVATGALDELEARIAALTDEAVASLDSAPIDGMAKNELRLLAQYVSWRDV
jgi:geranylgeranyl diphosphate synthase type I